jgi:hypothetical protein
MVSRVATLGLIAVSAAIVSAHPAAEVRVCPKCQRTYSAKFNFCERDGTRLLTQPQAPAAVNAAALAPGQVTLSWGDANSGCSVIVERRDAAADSRFVPVGQVQPGVPSYVDGSVKPETPYFYRVRLKNQIGFSAYSVEAKVTTLPLAPAVPVSIAAKPLEDHQVEVSWKDMSTNETEFRVERKVGTEPWQEAGRVGREVVRFVDTGVQGDTVYRYRVLALNSGGKSDYSSEVTVTTLPEPPPVVTNLAAEALSGTHVRLDWTELGTDEREFQVERRVAGGKFQVIATYPTDTTTCVDLNTAPKLVYYYRVRSRNLGGFSRYSAETMVSTDAAEPAKAPEPDEPAVVLQAIPTFREMKVGEYGKFGHRFVYQSFRGKLTARHWAFYTPDGRRLKAGSGKVDMDMPLPESGPFEWQDGSSLPAEVAKEAMEVYKVDAVMLRHYFEIQKEDGTKSYVSASVTYKIKP